VHLAAAGSTYDASATEHNNTNNRAQLEREKENIFLKKILKEIMLSHFKNN
jgi:hypothetical protein